MITSPYYNVDRKGRVVLPKAWRDADFPLVMVSLPDGVMAVLSMAEYARLINDATPPQLEYLQRLSAPIEGVDATTGRFQIPYLLRQHLRIRPHDSFVWLRYSSGLRLVRAEQWAAEVLEVEDEARQPGFPVPRAVREGELAAK